MPIYPHNDPLAVQWTRTLSLLWLTWSSCRMLYLLMRTHCGCNFLASAWNTSDVLRAYCSYVLYQRCTTRYQLTTCPSFYRPKSPLYKKVMSSCGRQEPSFCSYNLSRPQWLLLGKFFDISFNSILYVGLISKPLLPFVDPALVLVSPLPRLLPWLRRKSPDPTIERGTIVVWHILTNVWHVFYSDEENVDDKENEKSPSKPTRFPYEE